MRSLPPASARAICALVALAIAELPTDADAQVQTRGQQTCIAAVQRGFERVADTRLTWLVRCARRAALGEPVDACLQGASASFEKARRKAASMARNNCAETPDFGGSSDETTSLAGEEAATGLFADVFGSNLDDVLLETSGDKDASACQQSLAKVLPRCQRAHSTEFQRCARAGLKGGEIDDALSLGACSESDSRGAIARACETAVARVAEKCEGKGVDLAAAFPACNLTGSGRTLVACVARAAACRACAGESKAGELETACAACAPEPLAIAPEGVTVEDSGREGFPDAATLTSSVFEVGPEGTELERPIAIALPIDPNTPAGTRVEVLVLDETATAWEPVPGGFVAGSYAFLRTDRVGTFSTRANLSGTGCSDTWQAGGTAPVPPMHQPGAVQVLGGERSREEIVYAGSSPLSLGSSWSSESCVAPVQGTFGPTLTGEGSWRDESHALVTPIPMPTPGPFGFSIRNSLPAAPRGPHFAIADPCSAPLGVYPYALDVEFTSDCTDQCKGVTCDDGDPCTEDACDPGTGECVAPARTTCGTGDAGRCIQGACTLAVPLDGTTSGTSSCAAIGLACADPLPVFAPPEAACLTFHPTASVTVGTGGWQQSVWCDSDFSAACSFGETPKLNTCHDCPTCTEPEPALTCSDSVSTELSEVFVRCE